MGFPSIFRFPLNFCIALPLAAVAVSQPTARGEPVPGAAPSGAVSLQPGLLREHLPKLLS